MDLGSDVWIVIALVLPLLAMVVVLLLRQRIKLSKNVRWAGMIIVIALLAIYWVWSLFFRQ